MNKQERITKLVEEALGSVDNINRAEAKPYLLTRIHARMNKGTKWAWEKAGWFIGRPAVAFAGLCMIILINITAVTFNGTTSFPAEATEQVAQSPADEFSYTLVTIYDNENTQP